MEVKSETIKGASWTGSGRRAPRFALVVVVVVLSVTSALWVMGTSGPRASLSTGVLGSFSPTANATSPKYNVTFTETGLPAGTNWTAVLAGTHHTNNTTSMTVPQGNGTYAWSILWVEAAGPGVAGWAPNVSAGTLHVLGSSVTINVTFVTGYQLSVTGIGLPTDTSWKVTADNYVFNGPNNPHDFIVPAGSYYANVTSPVNGSTSGVRYVTSQTSTFVTVKKNASISVTFTTQFFLNTSSNPPAGGSVSPSANWFTNQSTVTLGETPSSGYVFLGWNGTGAGNYTGSSPAPTLTMGNPIAEVAEFSLITTYYAVSFTESGLPSGTNWSVTFNGTVGYSTTGAVGFAATNGTYAYSVGPISQYSAAPSAGNVSVVGANITTPIVFSALEYAVNFTESGLPSGTNWTVTLGGTPMSSTTPTIQFQEPNGKYSYSVGPVSGYLASPSNGSVLVNATNVSVSIAWTMLQMYAVTFSETGLAAGTSWTVALGGTPESSTSTSIVFTVPNGTYSVSIAGIAGYRLNGSAAGLTSVTVQGAPVSIPVSWAVVTYSVSFTETGLAAGTNWSVTLAGTTTVSANATITFTEANGSYPFVVGNVSGDTVAPQTGSVHVAGQDVSTQVTFTKSSTSTSSTGLSTLDWAVIATFVVIVVAVVLAVLLTRRRPKAPR